MTPKKLEHTHPPPEQPNAWHLHTAREGQPQEEHGKTNAAILGAAFIASFGFVGVVILVSYLYFTVIVVQKREERIETTVLGNDARAYKAAALAGLQSYTFAAEQQARAGVVSIPLDQAKQQVMAKYAGNTGNGTK
jgi:hypothetical protein